jgi:hypothetical protein
MVQMNRHHNSQAEGEERPDERENPGVTAIGPIDHRSESYSALARPATHGVNISLTEDRSGVFARSCGKRLW